MSKFLREMDARRARSEMLRVALREYEDSLRAEYGSPYACMAGALESMLVSLAADRLDSTGDIVRQLRRMTVKTKEMA